MTEQQTNDTPVLSVPELPKLNITSSKEEIISRVQNYKNNAETTLQKIKDNEAKIVEQLNKIQQMRLMILGQLELVNDLINVSTTQETTQATVNTNPTTN